MTNANNPLWTNLSQGEAQLACQGLGSEYHLIGENEWLTIAENIIRVNTNDINLETPGLQLATSVIASGSAAIPSTTENASSTAIIFTLSNNNQIHNLAGGVSEWTDQTVTKAGLIQPATNDWQEYNVITDYKGYNIMPPYFYNSANGIGRIKVGDNDSPLRAFVRGESSLFDLNSSYSPITATSSIGFRCAK